VTEGRWVSEQVEDDMRHTIMLAAQKDCDENDWPYPSELVKWLTAQPKEEDT
jgi:hypothetical protein